MTGNDLEITDRVISSLSIERDDLTYNIDGKYTATVVNNGMLPLFPVSLSVKALQIKSTEASLMRDERSSAKIMPPSESQKFTVGFSATIEESEIGTYHTTLCSGTSSAEVDYLISEKVSGLILGNPYKGDITLDAQNVECSDTYF